MNIKGTFSDFKDLNFNECVQELTIDSMEEFITFTNRLAQFSKYIWRGHRSEKWELKSTLARTLTEKSENEISEYMKDYLEKFKYSTRGRRGTNPSTLSDDEWWALGQHHGLLTPLLDWTTSPFVASFFAFSEEKDVLKEGKYRMVYALNKFEIERVRNLKKEYVYMNEIEFLKPQTDDNPRLVSQSGLFTKGPIQKNVENYVRENHKAYHTFEDGTQMAVLIKVKINEDLRNDFLVILNRMNINHLTLFPDLEGASLYTNMAFKIPNYIDLT